MAKDDICSKRARDRLSGALTTALENDLLDCLPDLSAGLDTPLKRIINSNSPWNSPSKSPRQPRRRRKKEVPYENAFHHTFVMKLFDRSVDLAQFPAGTSLYPVARAWMKNQPHNTNFAPRVRTPTPEPIEVPEVEASPMEEDSTGSDQAEKQESAKANDDPENEEPTQVNGHEPTEEVKPLKPVYKLPVFLPLARNPEGVEERLRIPSIPKPATVTFHLDEIQKPECSPEDLTQSHLTQWKSVRQRWRHAAVTNEERYADSLAVIQDMFEK
ncbi:protein lin-37 homolog [Tigriopus californicus]|uniref:protein lin-37 homolog n=1 Tax=Tigriopus californicus TaxID=6832 RepID=UPI0027DA2DFE|nr:protein lin-37 homolog [Tigriopus californicus]